MITLLLALLQAPLPAARLEAYRVRTQPADGRQLVVLDLRAYGPGEVEVPLPDDTPDSVIVTIEPQGSAELEARAGRALRQLRVRDSLSRIRLTWSVPATDRVRFRLLNQGGRRIDGLEVIQLLPPGQVPRRIQQQMPGHAGTQVGARPGTSGPYRTVELRLDSLPAAEFVSIEFASVPGHKSPLPLLIGGGIAILYLVRKRSLLRPPAS